MDIPNQVFGLTEKRFEGVIPLAPPEKMAVGGAHQLDEPGAGLGLPKKTSQDRLKLVADLHSQKLPDAVEPDLVGLSDRKVGGSQCRLPPGHDSTPSLRFSPGESR